MSEKKPKMISIQIVDSIPVIKIEGISAMEALGIMDIAKDILKGSLIQSINIKQKEKNKNVN